MEVGFIGLGNLGIIMTENLIERGHQVHIYNRSQEKMEPFKDRAVTHSSIASLAQSCSVVFSIVSDDKAVEAISLDNDSLCAHLKPGSVHVCLSTISPETAAFVAKKHQEKNIDYLTATVIGRPEAVKARNLIVCLSGTSGQKETVVELLKDLGSNRFYEFGEDTKKAAAVKLCTNFLIISALESMGEAFTLAEKAGVDVNEFYEMITNTVFSSPIYKNYGKLVLEQAYEQAAFTSLLGFKDVKLVLRLAEETGTTLPLADLIRNRFIINHNRGRQEWDWTSILAVIKEENQPLPEAK